MAGGRGTPSLEYWLSQLKRSGLEISNSVMAVTARSHETAYGHRTLTEWERAMTTLTSTTNTNRELSQSNELRDCELEQVGRQL
jgi:hypothetical protein